MELFLNPKRVMFLGLKMAQEERFKRNVAYKLRINDILIGKPAMDNERFSFLELGDKKIIRVNLIGNIVDRYEAGIENVNEDGKKYIFLTLDDGSGQIRLKIFGDEVEKLREITPGKTVIVIGTLRNWNNETYISPEIVKEADPRYLLIRKLETEKEKIVNARPIAKEQVLAVKDKILNLIKQEEERGGIDIEELNLKFSEISPLLISQEIQKLLEEGIIFEPRPGKIRYLG